MQHTNKIIWLVLLLSGMLILGTGGVNTLSAQCGCSCLNGISTTSACPGDTIAVYGQGFFGLSNATVGGVSANFNCIDCSNLNDTALVEIPSGIVPGNTVAINFNSVCGSLSSSVTITPCLGIVPDRACEGETVSIFEDFPVVGPIERIFINGVLAYDTIIFTPQPNPLMNGSYEVRIPIPTGMPQGTTINIELIDGRGSTLYPLFIKHDLGADFSYPAGPFCAANGVVSPSVMPLAPGYFNSVTPGLVIDTVNGIFDPAAVPAGTYTIKHITSSDLSCDTTDFALVDIIDVPSPAFTYANSFFCKDAGSPTPNFIDSTGGTFSASPGLGVHPNTGALNVTAAPPGNYWVYYAHQPGTACERIDSFNIDIRSVPKATFTYDTICIDAGINPRPLGTFDYGGTFTGTLLTITSDSGIITLDSIPFGGNFPVEYNITVNGCSAGDTSNLTVLDSAVATVNYPFNTYCQGAGTATPFSFVGGGDFSSTPPGLSIGLNNGVIDLNTSQIGTYTITYTLDSSVAACPNSSSQVMEIVQSPDAFFGYDTLGSSPTVYCQSDPGPLPQTRQGGGTFEELTANLIVDTTSGLIDLASSTPGGPYLVRHIISAGGCADTAFTSVQVVDAPDATFSYSVGDTFCQNGINPVPTITGSGGGIFSSPSLTLFFVNDSTGVIDLLASDTGPHSVIYATGPTGCQGLDTVPIVILPSDSPSFTFPATLCKDDPAIYPPTTWVDPGGTFNEPFNRVDIDMFTGEITPSNSQVGGPYTIYYTSQAPCSETVTGEITIAPSNPSGFYYPDTSYCPSDQDPVPVIVGQGGGVFTSATGISFTNPTSGIVDLNVSPADSLHVITYTSPGPCTSQSTDTILIEPGGVAGFSYNPSTICIANASNPFPVLLDTNSGGVFSRLDTNITIVDSTGEIDLANSVPGTYTIQYEVGAQGSGCRDIAFTQVVIQEADSSIINFDPQLGNNPRFCVNGADPIPLLNGTPGGQYFGSTGGGQPIIFVNSATGQVNLSATGPSTQPFLMNYSVTNCFSSQATLQFFIDDVDPADFNYIDTTLNPPSVDSIFCKSDLDPLPVTISATGGVFDESTDSLYLDPVTGVIDLFRSQPGTYNVTYITDTAQCPDTSSRRIQVKPDPTASLVSNLRDSIICEGTFVRFTGLGGNPLDDCFLFEIQRNNSGVWEVLRDTCDDITGNIYETTTLDLGLHQIRMTLTLGDTLGCSASEMNYVQVNPIPDGTILEIPDVIAGRERVPIIVQSFTPDTEFGWTLKGIGDVRPDFASGFTETLQAFETDTIFTTQVVTVSDVNPSQIRVSVFPVSNGCNGPITTDTIRVIPNNADFFIPEVISPNGNNQNDFWQVQWSNRIQPGDYYIEVFNRMGGLVYTLDRLDRVWYGSGLPDGIYWWVLRERATKNAVKKGGLKIIRE